MLFASLCVDGERCAWLGISCCCLWCWWVYSYSAYLLHFFGHVVGLLRNTPHPASMQLMLLHNLSYTPLHWQVVPLQSAVTHHGESPRYLKNSKLFTSKWLALNCVIIPSIKRSVTCMYSFSNASGLIITAFDNFQLSSYVVSVTLEVPVDIYR